MNFIARYFNWLQKGNPTGLADRFPEIDPKGNFGEGNLCDQRVYVDERGLAKRIIIIAMSPESTFSRVSVVGDWSDE